MEEQVEWCEKCRCGIASRRDSCGTRRQYLFCCMTCGPTARSQSRNRTTPFQRCGGKSRMGRFRHMGSLSHTGELSHMGDLGLGSGTAPIATGVGSGGSDECCLERGAA